MNEELFILKRATLLINESNKNLFISKVMELKNSVKIHEHRDSKGSFESLDISLEDVRIILKFTYFKVGGDEGGRLLAGFARHFKTLSYLLDDGENLLFRSLNYSIKTFVGINFDDSINSDLVIEVLKEIMSEGDFIFDGAFLMNSDLFVIARPKVL